jgi:hypothetical protein
MPIEYPLIELVCNTKMVYSEWLKVMDQITRELHGKDKETVDLAFDLVRKIHSVYGFLEYEGEVELGMDAKIVLQKVIGGKGVNVKYVNMVLTKIDQQLGRRDLYSRFKKLG